MVFRHHLCDGLIEMAGDLRRQTAVSQNHRPAQNVQLTPAFIHLNGFISFHWFMIHRLR